MIWSIVITPIVAFGATILDKPTLTSPTDDAYLYAVQGSTDSKLRLFTIRSGYSNTVNTASNSLHSIWLSGSNTLAALSSSGGGSSNGNSFNVNQFLVSGTSNVNIKTGALLTNVQIRGTSSTVAGIYSDATTALSVEGYNLRLRPTNNLTMLPINGYVDIDTFYTTNKIKLGTGGSPVHLNSTSTVGQVWTATTTDGGGAWAAATGGSGVTTNANQFGASTVLTLKEAPMITNLWLNGTNSYAKLNSSASAGIAFYGQTLLFEPTNSITLLPTTGHVTIATSAGMGKSVRIQNGGDGGIQLGATSALGDVWTATNTTGGGYWAAGATNSGQTATQVTNIVAGMTGPGGSNFISEARLAGSNYLQTTMLNDVNGVGFYKLTNTALVSTWNLYADYDLLGANTYSGNVSWRIRNTNIWNMFSSSVSGIDPDQTMLFQRTGLGVTSRFPMQMSSSNIYFSQRITSSNGVRLAGLTNATAANYLGQVSDGTVVQVTVPTGLSTNADQFAANTTLTLKTGAYLTNAALDRATNFVHGMEFSNRHVSWQSNSSGIIKLANFVPNLTDSFMQYNIGATNALFYNGYFSANLEAGNVVAGGGIFSGSVVANHVYVTNLHVASGGPTAGYVLTATGAGTGLSGWQVNPALGVSNQLQTASNFFNARQGGSQVLTNLAATGAMTNGLVGAGGVTLTTNGSHQVVITGAAGSTNLTTIAVGSITAGDGVFTNAVNAGSMTITNLAITFDTVLVSDANTNLTLNFNRASSDIYLTNSTTTFTNIAGLVSTNQANLTLRITPVGANRSITWPTLGGSSFGARFYTNANSPIWTTITNPVVVSMSAWGTNVHISMSEWK